MSELLTTGQMIDRLKVGEIAESGSMRITKREDGSFVHLDHPQGNVVLYHKVSKAIWTILPNYVSFEEAMKALKEGKTVSFELKNSYGRKIIVLDDEISLHSAFYGYTEQNINFLFENKWIIEGESNETRNQG